MGGLRYLGRGEFIPGVPARDLTAEEAARHAAVLAEHARNTGRVLYGPILAHEDGAGELARQKVTQRAGRAEKAAAPEGEGTPAEAGDE